MVMSDKTSRLEGLVRDNQTYLKMGFLLVLVLVLLVPLHLIEGVVSERALRHDTVVKDISRTWGEPQVLTGPMLIIPYRYTVERQQSLDTELVERKGQAFFLPDALAIAAAVEPELRYRGIFEAIVYTASLSVSGSFAAPDFAQLGVTPEDVFWSEAMLSFGISDLRGATGEPKVTWGTEAFAFVPGTGSGLLGGGVHAAVPIDPASASPVAFSLDLGFTGSRSIAFTPVGRTTRVELASSWPHPGFTGAYLPAERSVGDDGFKASWTVSYLGRDTPQRWTSRDGNVSGLAQRASDSRFGVLLISPVDFYLKSERSVKHGALLIVLIIAAIFIFEIVTPLRVHFFQYALVGFALCLFYLLLLSLAEIVGFLAAYVSAATMSTALITLYIAKVLASRKRALLIAGFLAAVYGYLYIILQLEALALVSGALGLFLALAAVMYATRNVDWYALGRAQDDAASQPSRSGQA
jgi:inner membrane protein